MELDQAETQTDVQETDSEELEQSSTENQQPEAPEESKGDPVPLWKHQKKKAKWEQRVATADQRAEELERKYSALQRENELLKLQSTPAKPSTVPSPYDFDDDAAYQNAMSEYIDNKAGSIAAKHIEDYSKRQSVTAAEAARGQAFDEALSNHYLRAESYADDYDSVEETARQHLGDDVARVIVEKFSNSEQVLYSLGQTPGEAQRIKSLAMTDPTQALLDVSELSQRLKQTPKTSEKLEPDEPLKGDISSANASWASQIEKSRQRYANSKADQETRSQLLREHMELKKRAAKEGYRE